MDYRDKPFIYLRAWEIPWLKPEVLQRGNKQPLN